MEGKSGKVERVNFKEIAGEFWVVFALGAVLMSAVFYKILA